MHLKAPRNSQSLLLSNARARTLVLYSTEQGRRVTNPRLARDAYAAAAAIDGSNAKWPYRLAFVLARTGHADDAIQRMRQSIVVDPTYAPAHRRLALWLLDRNDTDGAERAFSEAGRLDPGGMYAAVGLALVR